MKTAITKEQIKNIQIDHGVLYRNYGLEDQELIAPLRGGTNFKVEREYRNIEIDGLEGKTKGLKTMDDENATLTAKTLNASLQTFADKLPGATVTKTEGKITKIEAGHIGIIDEDAYIKNITMFAQTIGGNFKKTTLYKFLNESFKNDIMPQKTELQDKTINEDIKKEPTNEKTSKIEEMLSEINQLIGPLENKEQIKDRINNLINQYNLDLKKYFSNKSKGFNLSLDAKDNKTLYLELVTNLEIILDELRAHSKKYQEYYKMLELIKRCLSIIDSDAKDNVCKRPFTTKV